MTRQVRGVGIVALVFALFFAAGSLALLPGSPAIPVSLAFTVLALLAFAVDREVEALRDDLRRLREPGAAQ